MRVQLLAQWAILQCLVAAQTPPGFAPTIRQGLNVTFMDPGRTVSISDGMLVSPKDTISPPTILPLDHATGPFFLIMLDLDIAVNAMIRTDLLQWMEQDLVNERFSRNLSAKASPQESLIAPYMSPNPIPGTGKHRYLILLFTQPLHFQFPKEYAYLDPPKNVISRAAFNVTKFAAAAGLGEPVGATYWLEQSTNATSSGTAGSTGSSATGSGAPKGTSGSGTAATAAPSAFMGTGH